MATNPASVGNAIFTLLNAPDTTIGEEDAGKKAGQAFRIQLVQDLTKEMKDHIRHGKSQLVLGTNSVFIHRYSQCRQRNMLLMYSLST